MSMIGRKLLRQWSYSRHRPNKTNAHGNFVPLSLHKIPVIGDDKSASAVAPIYRVAERPTEVPSGAGGLQKV